MEKKVKKGKYHIAERSEKTTFYELMEPYKKSNNPKDYVLKFKNIYLENFKDRKLATITRSDLFEFKDKMKEIPKQRGGKQVKDSTVNRALAGLRRLFHFAMSIEYLEENPFPKDPKSKTTERFCIGQDDEYQREQNEKLIFKDLPLSWFKMEKKWKKVKKRELENRKLLKSGAGGGI